MASDSTGVNDAHPNFSGLAFARRATAEGYRLRAMAIDDAVTRKIYEGAATTYDRLADDLDRAAETTKRIDAMTKRIGSRSPEQPSDD
jgi:hypothetical protein